MRAVLQRTGIILGVLATLSACVGTFWWLSQSVQLAAPVQPEPEQQLLFSFEGVDSTALRLRSESVMLVDYDSGTVLYAKNCDSIRPIASISKLVTAMVVLDEQVNLSGLQTISREDARNSSRSRLAAGSRLSLYDLLQVSLLASDNRATRALARAVAGSLDSFVVLMNSKVASLGLRATSFHDPTGLDSLNRSTAHEVAKLIHFASQYPLISQITSKKNCVVRLQNRKNRILQFGNTNRLIYSKSLRVVSGKTGYIDESAHCLATILRGPGGHRYAVVVLGVPGDRLRFREAQRLVEWGSRHVKGKAA